MAASAPSVLTIRFRLFLKWPSVSRSLDEIGKERFQRALNVLVQVQAPKHRFLDKTSLPRRQSAFSPLRQFVLDRRLFHQPTISQQYISISKKHKFVPFFIVFQIFSEVNKMIFSQYSPKFSRARNHTHHICHFFYTDKILRSQIWHTQKHKQI